MIYLEEEIPNKCGYIVPIGDCHIGDKAFSKHAENKLKGYIKWIQDRDNARVILMGDILNCATRISATDPWDQTEGQEEQAIELFTPIKDKIVVAIDGNHEQRLIKFANYRVTQSLCRALGVKYGGTSCVVNFKVRKYYRKEVKRGTWRQQYKFYAHHTTGGGATVGGKINRVDKLRQMVSNADVYLGAHNHMLGAIPVSTGIIDSSRKKIKYPKQWIVDCGSYLDWENSYAEQAQFPPNKLGSPRIRLNGLTHDIHVSL